MKKNHSTKVLICLTAILLALAGANAARAQSITINFDTDAHGNALSAPDYFALADNLTTLYSSLGVTFSGTSAINGGAILNQNGNFGINALSGQNFLAFNSGATLANGGTPFGPETITFAVPANSVSIYASGSPSPVTLTLSAYDSGNNLLGSQSATSAAAWYLLSVATGNIAYVTLSQSPNTVAVYDNLTFSPVPEPTTLALAGLGGLAAWVAACRRR